MNLLFHSQRKAMHRHTDGSGWLLSDGRYLKLHGISVAGVSSNDSDESPGLVFHVNSGGTVYIVFDTKVNAITVDDELIWLDSQHSYFYIHISLQLIISTNGNVIISSPPLIEDRCFFNFTLR